MHGSTFLRELLECFYNDIVMCYIKDHNLVDLPFDSFSTKLATEALFHQRSFLRPAFYKSNNCCGVESKGVPQNWTFNSSSSIGAYYNDSIYGTSNAPIIVT